MKERFKTYIDSLTKEYTSWDSDYDEWVTHSCPVCYPLTHTKEEYKNYMVKFKPGVFCMPEHIELIEIEIKRI